MTNCPCLRQLLYYHYVFTQPPYYPIHLVHYIQHIAIHLRVFILVYCSKISFIIHMASSSSSKYWWGWCRGNVILYLKILHKSILILITLIESVLFPLELDFLVLRDGYVYNFSSIFHWIGDPDFPDLLDLGKCRRWNIKIWLWKVKIPDSMPIWT